MYNLWKNIEIYRKILIVCGFLIISFLFFKIFSYGLTNSSDEIISIIISLSFAIFAIVSGVLGFKGKSDRLSDLSASTRQYEVIKTAMYGNKSYGPYDSYDDAKIAAKELEAQSFDDEAFYEIRKVNSNGRDN